jgi:uncharacterized protein YjbJ (UPF0337 family)
MEICINRDLFEGKWKEMRGQAKMWWGKLTDDDLERAGGKIDQMIGLLQQKYGYSRRQAEQEFDQRLREAKAGCSPQLSGSTGGIFYHHDRHPRRRKE